MSMMFFWSKMSMMFVMPIKLLIDFHFPVSFKTSDKLWKDIFWCTMQTRSEYEKYLNSRISEHPALVELNRNHFT